VVLDGHVHLACSKKRGKESGFLRGTSDDPDPLLVITPDRVIEYKDERKPLTIVNFHDLNGMTLKATASTSSGSSLTLTRHFKDATDVRMPRRRT
jgi:hypothetical protein